MAFIPIFPNGADFDLQRLRRLADAINPNDAPTLQQVQNLINLAVTGGVTISGDYDASTNTPDLETPTSGAIKQGNKYIVSAPGDFFGEALEVGDTLVALVDDPSALGDWVVLQANIKDADDIDDTNSINKFVTAADLTNLSNLSGTNSGDEVEEFTNFAGFPGTGLDGVIYVAEDTGQIYRWDGAAYVELAAVIENLNETLAAGNITSGQNIVVSNNDELKFGTKGTLYTDGTSFYLYSDVFSGGIMAITPSEWFLTWNQSSELASGVELRNGEVVFTIGGEATAKALNTNFSIEPGHFLKLGLDQFIQWTNGDSFNPINGELEAPISASRSWQLPDASGTIALTTDIPTVSELNAVLVGSPLDTPYSPNNYEVVLVDAAGGNFVVNLPDAALAENFQITIKRIDATVNTVTVDGYLSQTINGATTQTIDNQNDSITLFCDGGEWHIIKSYLQVSASGLAEKSGELLPSAFVGNPKIASVTFSTAFASSNYSVSISGGDARMFTVENKTASGFDINSNSNQALVERVTWEATIFGES